MLHDDGHADDLLARALLDAQDAAAVALKVNGLALADALTVVFHGRRDLGTIQTYVANGGHGSGGRLRAPGPPPGPGGPRPPQTPPPPPGPGAHPAAARPPSGAPRSPSPSPRPTRAPRPRRPTRRRRARCATRFRPPTPSWRSGPSRWSASPSAT